MLAMLIQFGVLTVSMFAATKVLTGFQIKGGLQGHLVVAAMFAILNWLVGWAITFVLAALTFGLALLLGFVLRLIVTAIVLKITDAVTDRFHVRDFQTAFLGALVMAVAATLCDVALAHLGV